MEQWTAAHEAAQHGNLEVLQLLSDYGADFSLRDRCGSGRRVRPALFSSLYSPHSNGKTVLDLADDEETATFCRGLLAKQSV